jgi:hypothetical protein
MIVLRQSSSLKHLPNINEPLKWKLCSNQILRLIQAPLVFLRVHKSRQTFTKQTTNSVSELYRPSYRRLSAELEPTFADRGCRLVSVTDPYGRILGILYRTCYFSFQVAPQLYSRGWVDLTTSQKIWKCPDLWICSQELWPLDHRGGLCN